MDIDEFLDKINSHLHQGRCPTVGSIGECAAIYTEGDDYFEAYLYIWDAEFNDSTAVAEWFIELGAERVWVQHVLYCADNGDRDGYCPDGGRAWVVHFYMPESEGQTECQPTT